MYCTNVNDFLRDAGIYKAVYNRVMSQRPEYLISDFCFTKHYYNWLGTQHLQVY